MDIIGRLSPDEFWTEMERVFRLVAARAEDRVTVGVDGWPEPGGLGEWDLGDGTLRQVEYVDGARKVVVSSDPRDFGATSPVGEMRLTMCGSERRAMVSTEGSFTRAELEVDGLQLRVEAWRVDVAELELAPITDIRPYIARRVHQIAELRGETAPSFDW